MSKTQILIQPLEPYSFRDGRGFFGSGGGKPLSFPSGPTLRGIITTYLMRHAPQENGKYKKSENERYKSTKIGAYLPYLVPENSKEAELLWPAPADHIAFSLKDDKLAEFSKAKQRVVPLCPHQRGDVLSWGNTACLSDTPSSVLGAAVEQLDVLSPKVEKKDKPAASQAWWTQKDYIAWLTNSDTKATEIQISAKQHTVLRTHVAINPDTDTAKEGDLFDEILSEPYATAVLDDETGEKKTYRFSIAAQCENVAISAEESNIFTIGSKGRQARIQKHEKDGLFDTVNKKLLEAFQKSPKGIRLCLVTPGYFGEDGKVSYKKRGPAWLPHKNAQEYTVENDKIFFNIANMKLELRALAVGRFAPLTGWHRTLETTQSPKKTVVLAPAGSVYFLQKADGTNFTAQDFQALWQACFVTGLGHGTDAGLGRAVVGVWDGVSHQIG